MLTVGDGFRQAGPVKSMSMSFQCIVSLSIHTQLFSVHKLTNVLVIADWSVKVDNGYIIYMRVFVISDVRKEKSFIFPNWIFLVSIQLTGDA